MRDHLFNTEKIRYARGEKPAVDCILCAIRDGSPEVTSLEVYRNDSFIISVNLYPFNPGHLMIFPVRHITGPGEFSENEALELHRLTARAIDILSDEFSPSGFNVGYNIGKGSGASIDHIHQHIVPRYENEVGFLDVLAGTRVVVANPVEVREKLKARFSLLFP